MFFPIILAPSKLKHLAGSFHFKHRCYNSFLNTLLSRNNRTQLESGTIMIFSNASTLKSAYIMYINCPHLPPVLACGNYFSESLNSVLPLYQNKLYVCFRPQKVTICYKWYTLVLKEEYDITQGLHITHLLNPPYS